MALFNLKQDPFRKVAQPPKKPSLFVFPGLPFNKNQPFTPPPTGSELVRAPQFPIPTKPTTLNVQPQKMTPEQEASSGLPASQISKEAQAIRAGVPVSKIGQPGQVLPTTPQQPQLEQLSLEPPKPTAQNFEDFYKQQLGVPKVEEEKQEFETQRKTEQEQFEKGQAEIKGLIESSRQKFDELFNAPDMKLAREQRGQAFTELQRLDASEAESINQLKKQQQEKGIVSWAAASQSRIISESFNAKRAGFLAKLAISNDAIESGEKYASLAYKADQDALGYKINLTEQALKRNKDLTETEREEYNEILSRAKEQYDEKEKSKQTALDTYIKLASEGVVGINPTDDLQTMVGKAGPQLASIAKAKATQTGGFTPAQINSTVNQIAGAFDSEQIVKDFNQINSGYQTIKSIGTATTSPADDITFIYSFAKIMDPNSVVREGEYATIQKYAQTWADNFGFTAKRIFSNTNFLSQDAKEKMLSSVRAKLNTATAQYTNLYSEYQRQINDALTGKPRTIQEYSKAFLQPSSSNIENLRTKYNY